MRARSVLLAFLSSLACRPVVLEHDDVAEVEQLALAIAVAAPAQDPGGSGLWSHSGGPGWYPGATAACKAFAQTYSPPYKFERIEGTNTDGLMRCYVKPQHDNGPSANFTLVEIDRTVRPDPDRLKEFKCAVRQCDRQALSDEQWNKFVSADRELRCTTLGEMKHQCVQDRLSQNSTIRPERSYDMSKNPPRVVKDAQGNETVGYDAAKAAQEAQGLPGPLRRPDAIANDTAPYEIYEAKFPCSNKVKNDSFKDTDRVLRSSSTIKGSRAAGTKEKTDYVSIADGGLMGHGKVHVVSPADTRVADCK